MKKIKLLLIPNILFLILMVLICIPAPEGRKFDSPAAFIVVVVLAEAYYLYSVIRKESRAAADIATVIFAFFLFWEYYTKFGNAHKVLMPPLENVFNIFATDYPNMLDGLFASLKLLGIGVSLALILGVGLGIFVGWIQRLREAVFPIAKVLSTIPPLVYIPYVVAIMPTFRMASIFVVWSGVFWPTFMYVINYIAGIDKKILDSAKTLNVSTPTMIFKIILPYIFPGIIRNLALSISSAFMCLTGAEMIGASSGLGYYVQKAASFINYPKVLAGIIFIGIVVTVINKFVVFLEKTFIKW
jgi:NitT/TauT family transport system permease protein